jgi:hypothetical protein
MKNADADLLPLVKNVVFYSTCYIFLKHRYPNFLNKTKFAFKEVDSSSWEIKKTVFWCLFWRRPYNRVCFLLSNHLFARNVVKCKKRAKFTFGTIRASIVLRPLLLVLRLLLCVKLLLNRPKSAFAAQIEK